MPEPLFQRVSIVGVGLIGGSIALALRERGLAGQVVGVVRSAESATRLRKLNLVDQIETDLAEGVRGSDMVVVATPVGSIAQAVVAVAEHSDEGALVTDAGSTKRELVEQIEAGLAAHATGPRFIGSHPLAGDHRTGPEAARADLFDGAWTLVTPTRRTPEGVKEAITSFWQALGCQVESMTPTEHDELVALTSHVPHVAATALAATTPDESLPFTATGWADTTRVAAGSPSLWRDILLANRQAVCDGLQNLRREITAYEKALGEEDVEQLEKLLEEGRRRRDALGS